MLRFEKEGERKEVRVEARTRRRGKGERGHLQFKEKS